MGSVVYLLAVLVVFISLGDFSTSLGDSSCLGFSVYDSPMVSRLCVMVYFFHRVLVLIAFLLFFSVSRACSPLAYGLSFPYLMSIS